MSRRRVLHLLLALIGIPSLAYAQPARKPVRVGVLSSASPEARSTYWDAFKNGMAKLGWVEGRDVSYVYRYTRGDSTRFKALASELVSEKPDLIFAGTQTAALAVKSATREIPIVFAFVTDPVGSGLVASLARPGGNATGLSGTSIEMTTKGLELLKEIHPQLRRVAIWVPRGEFWQQMVGEMEQAARPRGIQIEAVVVGNQDEMEKSLQSVAGKRVDGAMFHATGMMVARQRIAARMAELRLPAIYPFSEIVAAGGLISYGVEIADNYRRAAGYVDRILKGAKPADLPVEQPSTFELVVNRKAAHALGIKIPQSVLLRATSVIE